MPDNIKNQFNESTLHNPVFHLADGGKGPDKLLTTASAAVPASFLGREQELTDIRGLLTRQNTLALVNAEGGMGKTTLAARYWQQYENEYRHLAWLFCESGILSAMRNQLPDALGLREAMNQCADNPEKQVQVLKAAMANLPKDCLLVLDNANDPDHIRGFQQQMAGLGWHVLVTSRCSKVLTDAASEYRITGLPPARAKELFKKNHDEGTPEFEALLDRFLRAVDRNTLCIEVFSKNLREGAALDMTLAGLLEKLEQTGLFLGNDSFEVQTDYVHNIRREALKSTDEVIEALYDVADLQRQRPELHDLLATLALLPAENHPPTLLGALLAPDGKPGLKRRLDQLAQKGWLATDTATYRISPVLQKILLHRNAERRWELGEPMVLRLHVIFETEGYHSKNIATAGPYAELVFGLAENLDAANRDLAILFDRLWVYHYATGNLAKALDAANQMREISRRTGDNDGLAIAYEKLGSAHTALGNLDHALTFFERFYKLSEELYDALPTNVSFKNGLAISYSKLGDTHTALGNLDKALTFFERFSKLSEELYAAFPQNVEFKNGLAVSYANLGCFWRDQKGDRAKAKHYLEQCYQLWKALAGDFPGYVEFQKNLRWAEEQLADLET
jgi:tetratricopeptide (TPR) repeat protein